MKRNIQIPLSLLFWMAAAVDIIGIATNNSVLHYIAKPLLIPILLLLLAITPTVAPRKYLLLAGLFFSWAGDMFLLFEDRNNLFFIFGLVAFLTTHIFYIVYFLKIQSNAVSLLKKQPLLIALVLGYGVTLVYILLPHLGDLKIPVMVYAAVICTMLLCSLHVFFKVNKPANGLYIAGAVFFVLSDSLLALNKFYQPFTYAGVLIMGTYCAAQYFIVSGFIKQQPHD
jgi:uncharacterized membrane protein YhhN